MIGNSKKGMAKQLQLSLFEPVFERYFEFRIGEEICVLS